MGDLQPPSYDYWVARYNEGQRLWAYMNIAIIWALWFVQIVLLVICMLNFLIAIVSDSYNWIQENQKVQRIERQETINMEAIYNSVNSDGKGEDEGIDVIQMYSDLSNEEDTEWEGTTRVIKKCIKDLEVMQR